jgi:multidrug efflux pump subunit AcrB
VLAQVEAIVGKMEGVESFQTIGGYGVVTSTYQPNFGTIFVRLAPWDERKGEENHVAGYMQRLRGEVGRIPEAIIFPFNIPTISGFGASAGFNFLIQDRSGSLSIDQLGELSRTFMEAARKRPEIGNIFTSFDPRYPQVRVELDREKARKLGVPVDQAYQVLATSLGGSYVNDFNRFGRLYRVYVQAEADYRRKPDDIGHFWVRSETTGDMIPLGTLVSITPVVGTELTNRSTCCAPSSSTACLAPDMHPARRSQRWKKSRKSRCRPRSVSPTRRCRTRRRPRRRPSPPSSPRSWWFPAACRAYESWRLPWAVLLGSPLVALGAFFGVWLGGFDKTSTCRSAASCSSVLPRRTPS